MGFFSWKCAKSEKPVMGQPSVIGSPWHYACKVVVLFKDGSKVYGEYDGYGRVYGNAELSLVDVSEDSWRMVIQDFYKGESFEDLKPNKHDPKQGFFYSDDELLEIFSCKVV